MDFSNFLLNKINLKSLAEFQGFLFCCELNFEAKNMLFLELFIWNERNKRRLRCQELNPPHEGAESPFFSIQTSLYCETSWPRPLCEVHASDWSLVCRRRSLQTQTIMCERRLQCLLWNPRINVGHVDQIPLLSASETDIYLSFSVFIVYLFVFLYLPGGEPENLCAKHVKSLSLFVIFTDGWIGAGWRWEGTPVKFEEVRWICVFQTRFNPSEGLDVGEKPPLFLSVCLRGKAAALRGTGLVDQGCAGLPDQKNVILTTFVFK